MANCHNCERLVICPWANPEEIICSSFKAKPITNADRIRAMTDEELAEFVRKGCDDRECPDISFPADTPFAKDASNEQCRKCWLDWLKEEIE